MKIYKPIKPINVAGGESLNELKIRVEYTKGGYNSKRGVYAWITPVYRGEHFERSIMLGGIHECGLKVCLMEMARKSQKVEDAICAVVERLSDKIAEHYNKCEYHDISRRLLSAINENIQ